MHIDALVDAMPLQPTRHVLSMGARTELGTGHWSVWGMFGLLFVFIFASQMGVEAAVGS